MSATVDVRALAVSEFIRSIIGKGVDVVSSDDADKRYRDSVCLTFPFPSQISPWADIVEENAERWSVGMGLLRDEEHSRRTRMAAFGEYASRQYPAATRQTIELAAYLTHYMFHFDDHMARLAESGGSVAQAECEVDRIRRSFRHGADSDFTPGGEFSIAGRDLRTRLGSRPISDYWLERILEHIDLYLQAHVLEAANLYHAAAPTLADYIKLRRHLGAPLVFTDLCEIVADTPLPVEIYKSPECQKMLTAWSDIALWTNDMASFLKEKDAGDCHNLGILIMRETGVSTQQALRYVAERIKVRLDEYVEYVEAFSRLTRGHARLNVTGTERYLSTLGTWLSGHLTWHMNTSRYQFQ
ncbi:terpene synthase family protein [Nocardia brasiliensis]|uniref:terpene synthase family protein n=1 Tax=Nocardia brasiliensis TaxID=37326 RepID=UPI0024569212|nr:hypothetical protein [Nocardia brasiliensis]